MTKTALTMVGAVLLSMIVIGCEKEATRPEPTPWWKDGTCSGSGAYVIENRWSSSDLSPVFRLDNTLSSDWCSAAEAAMYTWNSVGTRLHFMINRTPVSGGARQDRRNTVSREPLPADQLGVCQTYVSATTNRIVEADVIVNSTRPLTFGASATTYDALSVLVHELGHACGLGHVGDRTQTMYASMPPDCVIYRTLCDGDRAGLFAAYGAGAEWPADTPPPRLGLPGGGEEQADFDVIVKWVP
jgi:hypothetical protein